jgi:hypothetical protein
MHLRDFQGLSIDFIQCLFNEHLIFWFIFFLSSNNPVFHNLFSSMNSSSVELTFRNLCWNLCLHLSYRSTFHVGIVHKHFFTLCISQVAFWHGKQHNWTCDYLSHRSSTVVGVRATWVLGASLWCDRVRYFLHHVQTTSWARGTYFLCHHVQTTYEA